MGQEICSEDCRAWLNHQFHSREFSSCSFNMHAHLPCECSHDSSDPVNKPKETFSHVLPDIWVSRQNGPLQGLARRGCLHEAPLEAYSYRYIMSGLLRLSKGSIFASIWPNWLIWVWVPLGRCSIAPLFTARRILTWGSSSWVHWRGK